MKSSDLKSVIDSSNVFLSLIGYSRHMKSNQQSQSGGELKNISPIGINQGSLLTIHEKSKENTN